MTRRELMLRTLERVTGEPRQHLEHVLDHIASNNPGGDGWGKELPPEEQEMLEKGFEKEGSGILAWYVRQMKGNEELIRSRGEALRQENAATHRKSRKH